MARRGTLFGAGRGHPMYWAGCGGRGGCDKGAQGPGAPPRFEKRTTFHPSAIITFSRFGRLLQGGTPRTSGLRGGTPPTCAPRSGFRPTTKVAGVVGASTWAHNYALKPPWPFYLLPELSQIELLESAHPNLDVFDWRSRHKNAFPVPRHATTNLLAESVARGTSSVLCGRQNPLHADRRCTPEG